RLLSRWLGVSVSTMLLADELISEAEASAGTVVDLGVERSGRGWGTASDFFQQGRKLVQNGIASGSITPEQAGELTVMLDRLELERRKATTTAWAPGELRKTYPASRQTPRAARDAVSLVAGDIPSDAFETARLLTSELVTNSLKYGPPAPASIGLYVGVARDLIRVEVWDEAAAPPELKTPSEHGGYGLALVDSLATRWGTDRDGDRNVTWFELALPAPGA
ncbi:MAG TPA: ATP-binding protein, partial [Gaiellales bacterium]|nr:ATP-binding protein [Gaiellales bacterium]